MLVCKVSIVATPDH